MLSLLLIGLFALSLVVAAPEEKEDNKVVVIDAWVYTQDDPNALYCFAVFQSESTRRM